MTYSVAVSGASGYAGGEILRLFADHPEFEVRTVTAHSNAGQPLVALQPHLRSLAHLTLADTTAENLAGHDVVFLALPHGKSGAIAAQLARRRPRGRLRRRPPARRRQADWAEFYGGDFHGAWPYGVPELPRPAAHAARPARRRAADRRARLQRSDRLAWPRARHRRRASSRPPTSSRCSPSARPARARA